MTGLVILAAWLAPCVWLLWGDLGEPRPFTPEWFRKRRPHK